MSSSKQDRHIRAIARHKKTDNSSNSTTIPTSSSTPTPTSTTSTPTAYMLTESEGEEEYVSSYSEDELATSRPPIVVGTNPSVVIARKRTVEQRSPQKESHP
jgi:hypothetical protein